MIRALVCAGVMGALVGGHAFAQSASDAAPQSEQPGPGGGDQSLKRLSIEELSRIEVVSASRVTTPAADAAASMTVVTGDMIRRAGVTTLADALRLAVGVSVAREGYTWAVSARGFGASTANKMAVFIDGRSVYTPLFSGVFWDAQDVLLADVDRIEVIRGAGGTLWGANAANGVINVITKLAGDTQGVLVQAGGGNQFDDVSGRVGGRLGQNSAYRVYAKVRRFGMQPLQTSGADGPLVAGQTGFRIDSGAALATSITFQGDAYSGQSDLTGSPGIAIQGQNLLLRVRHTFRSGGQVQFQAYYDGTYRKPPQYTERRNTGDVELQYRVSWGSRQGIVAGVGYDASHDRVTSTPVLFFSPPSRTLSLPNAFLQDEVQIVPDRLALIAGSELGHNSYTGLEIQPTLRVRWTPKPGRVAWAAISRAVRMPSRFDTDLRFTANTPVVLLTGSPDFRSEKVVSGEAGFRVLTIPKVTFSITAFLNSYNDLRTQEPTVPTIFPVTLGNNENARVSGSEVSVHVEPVAAWQVFAGYTYLAERFSLDAGSLDATGGASEHNDPANQVWLRSFMDLPAGFSFDAVARWVDSLPRPVVPSYAELSLHGSHALGHGLRIEIVGDNLLHGRHLEFAQLGPAHLVPRSGFVALTWERP